MLEILSLGGPTPNRFDAPRTSSFYLRQIGNLETELTTDEFAFFAQDAWRLTPEFTLNYGLRWEGTFNPTPDANNDFPAQSAARLRLPDRPRIDPTQIPDQLKQFGPRVGFAWDPGDRTTVVRGYTGIYYARSPMLLFSDPMNNFRVPPGNVSVRLPFPVPASNPNDTLLRAVAAHRHRSEQLRRLAICRC